MADQDIEQLVDRYATPDGRPLISPWWLGTTSDHLFEQCPARQRSLPELRRCGWDKQGIWGLDPEGTDVCGICFRWWRARSRTEVSS